MAEVLKIRLNDTVVGTITNAPYDRNIFAFEDSYLQDPLAPVLSLGYYDVEKNLIATPQQQTTKLPPFFSNLLPEGVLREFVAAKAVVNGKQEFFLLWLLGADLPGAIVVEDANGRALPPKSIEGDRARELPQREVMRFSLAGVQLKFSAAGNSKGLTIPIEGVGGSWIVKLPDQRFKGVPENEFSMMTLAREIGI